MSERFEILELIDEDDEEISYLVSDGKILIEVHTENEECAIKLKKILNEYKKIDEQQNTIEELQQKYDKLCIEMANIYSKYIFMKEFSKDTNPNEAVKYVLRELMQKTKEARRYEKIRKGIV